MNRNITLSLLLWFVVLGAVGVAVAFLRGLNDADLFWHLLNGEQLVRTGRPVVEDPYSFTFQGGSRLPHEWLSEGLMYLLVEIVGPDLALGLFAIALPAGLVTLGAALVGRGVSVTAVVIGTILPALVALPYVSVRPQVLSWSLLAVLLGLLVTIGSGRRRRLILLAIPLFVLWANLHGLYAVGMAVLVWYCLWTFLGRTEMRRSRLLVVTALLGSMGGTVLTPGGLSTLVYPLRFLRANDWGLENIPEWSSPNFHDAVQLPLLLLIVALAILGRGRAPGWLAGLADVGVVMALLANRNAPVLAVLAVPVVSIAIHDWLARIPRRSGAASPMQRRAVELLTAAMIVIACAAVVNQAPKGIQLGRFPDESMELLIERHPDARVFAEYGWGGYVAYRLHDRGGRVFVDGRNDMYPEQVLEDYVTIRDAEPGWDRLLHRYDVDAILLQSGAPLARVALLDDWCEAYRDDVQTLVLPCEDLT